MEAQSSGTPRAADRQVEQWLEFALLQEGRAAPHPSRSGGPGGVAGRTGGGTGGGGGGTGGGGAFRLTLSHLEAVPLFQGEDRNFDVRLGVTLFDEEAGCFFGPTARTAPVSYDMKRSKGKRGFHLDLDCSLFMHTQGGVSPGTSASTVLATGAVDAAPSSSGGRAATLAGTAGSPGANTGGGGLVAVAEVVLVERCDSGLACAEVSAGWCAIPLELPSPGSSSAFSSRRAAHGGTLAGAAAAGTPAGAALGSPFTPLRAGVMATRLGHNSMLCVPVFVGSPRFLLLQRTLPPGNCPAPPQLLADGAECRLHYQFEACPEVMRSWGPLVPSDFLVSSRDLVPGLQRVDANEAGDTSTTAASGAPTYGALCIASQLAPPRLHDVHAVVLAGLTVHLPEGFVEVVRKQAAGLWRQAHGAAGGALPGSTSTNAPAAVRLLPLREVLQSLVLRVTAHNGRRFVGPSVLCPAASLLPVEGRRGEHVLALARDAPLAWLPADRHVVLLLELLLLPSGSTAGSTGGTSSTASGPPRPGETVLGWTAVAPFLWPGGRGSGHAPVLAQGVHQAALRSGPGRWVRYAPVLDWRRLLERTNRRSPQPPLVSFVLQDAPGQAVWPPPAAAVTLRPTAAVPPPPRLVVQAAAPVPSPAEPLAAPPHSVPADLPSAQHRRQTDASEAETLVSMRHAAHAGMQPQEQLLDKHLKQQGKTIARQLSVQAWQIQAHHEIGSEAGDATTSAWEWEAPPLPSIRTRPKHAQQAASADEAAALYAGSPSAKQAGQGSRGAQGSSGSAWEAAAAAAALAVPAAEVAERHVSLQAELDGGLASTAASLQFLGFEVQAGSRDTGAALQAVPQRLHFTFRFFHSHPPTVTAPLHLLPVPEAWRGGSNGKAGCKPAPLFALTPGAAPHVRASSSSENAGGPLAPEVPLTLLDAAALEQQAAELAEHGAPAAAAAGLAWQQHLRAAGYLAERRLQVDVWDSDSLLQVGTLSVPLRGLLHQGLPAAEVLLRVPVTDQAQGVERVEGGGAGSGVRLSTGALQGSFLLRLGCRGTHLPPGSGGGGSSSGSGWPASPVKRGSQPVVVQAGVAGVAEQRGRQVQGEVEREAGKRDAILRRLQSELPSCVALCVAPGEAVGFEREFVNSSSQDAWFTLSLHDSGSNSLAGSAAFGTPTAADCSIAGGGRLSLVSDAAEWQALEAGALHARLALQRSPAGGSSSLRAISGKRFRLAPHERCLLRFCVSRELTEELTGEQPQHEQRGQRQHGMLCWHDVSIRRSGGGSPAGAVASEVAATFRVAVLPLAAPVADRTVRLYCPAGAAGGAAAAVHAVRLEELPDAGRLLAAAPRLAFLASCPEAAATMQHGRLLLSCLAPTAGASTRFLLAAYARGRAGSSDAAGTPVELWEVFLHGLPAVHLAAGVGAAASARRLLPALQAAGELSCHWRGWGGGAGSNELQASLGTAAAAGRAGSGRLALSFEPASVEQGELLLSVTVQQQQQGAQHRGRQQAEVLLLSLDSSSTAVSRVFEVAVPAGQELSKKVRYCSPYQLPRRFRVRLPGGGGGAGSGSGALLRVGRPEFELAGGESTAIKLRFDGGAAAAMRRSRHEVLVVLESAPVHPPRGTGSGLGGRWDSDEISIEEVFCVVLTVT